MQAVALHRDAHRRYEGIEEVVALEQPRVVQDRTDPPALVLDERRNPRNHGVNRGERARAVVYVDIPLALPVPPEEIERRVIEDLA